MDFGDIQHEGYVEIFLLCFGGEWKFDNLILNIAFFFNITGHFGLNKTGISLKKNLENILLFFSTVILIIFKQILYHDFKECCNIRLIYSTILRFLIFNFLKKFEILKKRRKCEIFFISHFTEKMITRCVNDGHIWIVDFFGLHVLTIFLVLFSTSTFLRKKLRNFFSIILIFSIPLFGIMPFYLKKVMRMLQKELKTITWIFASILIFSAISFSLMNNKSKSLKTYIRKIFHFLSVLIFTSILTKSVKNYIYFIVSPHLFRLHRNVDLVHPPRKYQNHI